MNSRSAATIALALCSGLFASTPARAAAPKFDWKSDVRLRAELTESPSGDASKDASYDLSHDRLRLGADLTWPAVRFHAMVQAAGSWGLPSNGAFGAGPVHFGANGESEPDSVDLAELTIAWTGKTGKLWSAASPGRRGTRSRRASRTSTA